MLSLNEFEFQPEHQCDFGKPVGAQCKAKAEWVIWARHYVDGPCPATLYFCSNHKRVGMAYWEAQLRTRTRLKYCESCKKQIFRLSVKKLDDLIRAMPL